MYLGKFLLRHANLSHDHSCIVIILEFEVSKTHTLFNSFVQRDLIRAEELLLPQFDKQFNYF